MDKFEAAVKAAEDILRDEKGRAVLSMEIKNASEVFSNISLPGKPVISSETGEFILNLGEELSSDEKVLIKIKGDFSAEEQELFRKGAYEYFVQRHISAKRELSRNRFRLAMLFGIGLFILGSSYLFKRDIWSEVGNIAAWVLIWKMVDLIAFDNRSLVSDKRRFRSFAEAEIEFE